MGERPSPQLCHQDVTPIVPVNVMHEGVSRVEEGRPP
jgi:hypothetical protein